MKFSTSFLVFLLSAASASASFTIRSKSATASLLSKARRLEDNEEEEEEQQEYQFLMSYSVKLIGCAAGWAHLQNGRLGEGFGLPARQSRPRDSGTQPSGHLFPSGEGLAVERRGQGHRR